MRKKRVINSVMALFMVLTLFSALKFPASAANWADAASGSFAGGDGLTAGTAFEISTAAELAYMAYVVNNLNTTAVAEGSSVTYGTAYYELTADIALNDTSNWEHWDTSAPAKTWTPIGISASYPFNGTFDGGGRTVYGVYINDGGDNKGLFGYTKNSTIKNLHVAEGYLKGHASIGGIVGYALNTNITNCENAASVIGTFCTGGIAGNLLDGSITSCVNNGSIGDLLGVVPDLTGGIVGDSNSSSVLYCVNHGSVTSCGRYTGGIAGQNLNFSLIAYCVNTGSVYATMYDVGGVAGMNQGAFIRFSFNIGSVTGKSNCVTIYAGGIVGRNFSDDVFLKYNPDTPTAVEYCYNAGSLSSLHVGGIVGLNLSGKVNCCYNSGTNSGWKKGGIVSYSYSGKILNCYYDNQLCPYPGIDTSGSDEISAIEGRTTANMVGNALESLLSDVYWTYNTDGSGTYPCLKDPTGGEIDMDTSPEAYVSASPVFLNGETASSVQKNFTVSLLNSVSWACGDGSVINITSGNAGIETSADSGVALTASLGGITKAVFLSQVIAFHSVTYTKDAGTGELPTQNDVQEGRTFTVASGSGLTRDGFIFCGWSDDAAIWVSGSVYTVGPSDVALTAVWKANAPSSAPTLVGKTNTAITVGAVTGYEYSRDNGVTWQTSNIFTGLTAGTTYNIRTRVAASGDDLASDAGPLLQVATKAVPAAPSKPAVKVRTNTSIEVNTVTGQEYAIKKTTDSNYGVWQTSGLFEGLTADTYYYIITRTAETEYAMPSAASAALLTDTKAALGSFSPPPFLKARTDSSIEVDTYARQEYAIKKSADSDYGAWQGSGLFEGLTANTSYNIVTRTAETEYAMPGPASDALQASTKTVPATTPAAPTANARTDYSIEVDTVMGQEYAIRKSGDAVFGAWRTPSPGTLYYMISFSRLSPDTDYEIITRIAETEQAVPSAVSAALQTSTKTASAAEAPAAPTVKMRTNTSIEINTVTGQEYAIKKSGDSEFSAWQSSGLFEKVINSGGFFFPLEGLSADTHYEIITRVAETDDTMPSAVSAVLQTSTKKAPAKAPAAPTVKVRTDTSIDVNTVPGQEYAIKKVTDADYGAWQSSGLFEGLTADTDYKIITRVAETEAAMPSAVSTVLQTRTKTVPAAAPAAPADHLSAYSNVDFPFKDVAEDAWYYGSVAYAYNNGLFSGTSEAAFSPDTAMTRQMIWTVLARMDGKTPADMGEARAWAMENGISDGTNPTAPITREQMATILYRYAQYKNYDTTQGGMAIREFADYDRISDYALTALGWSVNAGLMQGSCSNLMPAGSATRAQVATILKRFCQNVAE